MAIDYSIVIPAYNEEGWLPATLDTLRQAMEKISLRGEIIVTDNNSTDATADVARRHGVHVVYEAINQISRARNTGAREAQGRYLVFVDADTLVSPELLDTALQNLESERCIGGGAVAHFEEERYKAVHFVVGCWNLLSRSLRLAAGCFFYCRKDAFEQAGGFSEAVYASEEIWLSKKLGRIGRKQGRKFCIIHQYHVQSSGRKIVWYSTGRQFGVLAMVFFFPAFVRFRRLCSYWYDRPKANRR